MRRLLAADERVALHGREHALLAAHEEAWLGPPRGVGDHHVWWRGLLGVDVSVAGFLRAHADLVRSARRWPPLPAHRTSPARARCSYAVVATAPRACRSWRTRRLSSGSRRSTCRTAWACRPAIPPLELRAGARWSTSRACQPCIRSALPATQSRTASRPRSRAGPRLRTDAARHPVRLPGLWSQRRFGRGHGVMSFPATVVGVSMRVRSTATGQRSGSSSARR